MNNYLGKILDTNFDRCNGHSVQWAFGATCVGAMGSTQQNQIYPLWLSFWITLGPMMGRRMGPQKIHSIRTILLVSIYVILGFHGKRSNMTRNILSSPPFGPLFAFGGLEGWPIHNMPHPIDVSCSNMRCPRCSWR